MTIRARLYADREIIVARIKEGDTTTNIAKDYDCNCGSIWWFLKELGVKPNKKMPDCTGRKEEYKEIIVRMFEDGLSTYRISKEVGVACITVCKWLNSWGYGTSRGNKVNKDNLMKDKSDRIIELHRQGKNAAEIGREVGHCQSQIYRFLIKEGIYEKPDYKVNEKFFERIDSEAKAYVLGWFYSDGNVRPSGLIRIQISDDDRHILEEIKKLMEYEGPISVKESKNKKRKNIASLNINRMVLARQLINLGCPPKKSLILNFPTLEQVPENLIRHFIRGYFDGDGSISIRKNKYLCATITATDVFNNRLQEILSGIDIDCQQYYRYPGKTCTTSLQITKTEHAIKFCKWIYQDSSFFLPRKRQKYEDFLADYS